MAIFTAPNVPFYEILLRWDYTYPCQQEKQGIRGK